MKNADRKPAVRRRFLIVCLLVTPLLVWAAMNVDELRRGKFSFLPWGRGPGMEPENYWPIVVHRMPTAWLDFVERVWPGVHADAAGIALAALCAALLGTLLHFTARRFSRAWTWRSTTAALLLPGVLFAIILGTGGASSRLLELRADPKPIEYPRMYFELSELKSLPPNPAP